MNASLSHSFAEANAKVIDEVAEANAKVIDEVAEANAKESIARHTSGLSHSARGVCYLQVGVGLAAKP